MKSYLLSHLLLLAFLSSRAAARVKASDSAIRCGVDNCCQSMAKLMTAVSEINNKEDEQAACSGVSEKLDKQAKDLEEQKEKLDKSLASTAAISTQLDTISKDLLSHDERLKTHDVSQTDLYQLVKSIRDNQPRSMDCSDIRERGSSVSGVYRVYLSKDNKQIEVDVYCDFQSLGQSWLVFQRRKDGSVNFERSWTDYERGFGDLTGEFWLGNEKLSLLTLNRKYKLRVELEDFEGEKRYAEYSSFSVQPATEKYRLTVGGYSGTAGDSLVKPHNGMKFTTKDADNDVWSGNNCAIVYHGAWWYETCHYSNLNGLYLKGPHSSPADGVNWNSWRGHRYSLKMTEMKLMAI